jgi:hypothetical protein
MQGYPRLAQKWLPQHGEQTRQVVKGKSAWKHSCEHTWNRAHSLGKVLHDTHIVEGLDNGAFHQHSHVGFLACILQQNHM